MSNPAQTISYNADSLVETKELERSGRKLIYPPTEKIPVIEVVNFPMLGKLVALRFVEWVLKNPGGVISLPTGKTPEHFIAWVRRILEAWDSKEIQSLLAEYGLFASRRPNMGSLTFVQIDEFYPMDSTQRNSFHWYVNEFYIKGFGLSKEKALLIDATSLGLQSGQTMRDVFPNFNVDLTLRVRQTRSNLERLQKDVINRVDEWCMEYESKIRELGGIGFFLGGIGPDGHIAFNVRGSSIHSVTRLTGTNYETQAAAATDLGGIEISRNRLVITIGLATITYNSTCTAIVMAAGDAKAHVVAQAIQEKKSPRYPASVLQDLPNARFYLTRGAASQLLERRLEDFHSLKEIPREEAEDIVIRLALSTGKKVLDVTKEDFTADKFGCELLQRTSQPATDLVQRTYENIILKLQKGLNQPTGTVFLHTEPHHDDIMLGYQAYVNHLVRDPSNKHYFANLTSGFTSVANAYTLSLLQKVEQHLDGEPLRQLLAENYFHPTDHSKRMQDVYLFLDGTAANSKEMRDEAESRRMFRNLVDVFNTVDIATLRSHLNGIMEYLRTQYPGAKDPPEIQTLKGMIREWEVELLWAYVGIESSAVYALRLGFYTGDIFSQEPDIERDVRPILSLIEKVKPDVVTVAFDPEGSGPDTHYKTLQTVAEALRLYTESLPNRKLRVWGYRNVWYRFSPAEANIYVPASLNSFATMNAAFMNCFGSQRAASFPSYEHDGPFSDLAQKIQAEQYGLIKSCLGHDYFLKSNHAWLRAAHGLIFLKEMDLPEFFAKVRELKGKMESVR